MSAGWSFGTARQRDEADRLRRATMARYRQRLVDAAEFDPETLSEQGQRILRWLTEWDDWTVGGLEEIFGAIRTAAQVAVHREEADRTVEALRQSEKRMTAPPAGRADRGGLER